MDYTIVVEEVECPLELPTFKTCDLCVFDPENCGESPSCKMRTYFKIKEIE